MKAFLSLLFSIGIVSIALSGAAVAATPDEEVARYAAIFSGDRSLHSDAADTFAWMGISDPRVFDIIERHLLEDYKGARNDRDEKNRVARYIRALGFSGQAKYEATIRSFINDSVYERYAKAALVDSQQYRVWNPIISNRANFDFKYSDEVNRVRNMLRADDLLLKRVGAKRVYFGTREDELYDLLARDLKANYMSTEAITIDPIAWLAKALGTSKSPKYRPLLEEVVAKAPDLKIRNYAMLALH